MIAKLPHMLALKESSIGSHSNSEEKHNITAYFKDNYANTVQNYIAVCMY
jgi:hypothetical protein